MRVTQCYTIHHSMQELRLQPCVLPLRVKFLSRLEKTCLWRHDLSIDSVRLFVAKSLQGIPPIKPNMISTSSLAIPFIVTFVTPLPHPCPQSLQPHLLIPKHQHKPLREPRYPLRQKRILAQPRLRRSVQKCSVRCDARVRGAWLEYRTRVPRPRHHTANDDPTDPIAA